MSENQRTVSTEAAEVAEVLGKQKTSPVVIADPTGGATQDAEARTALIAVLDLLRKMGVSTAS